MGFEISIAAEGMSTQAAGRVGRQQAAVKTSFGLVMFS
jgi:hypothetical protein